MAYGDDPFRGAVMSQESNEATPILVRPQHGDNSGLRARLAGAAVEDRPIIVDLRAAIEERPAIVEVPEVKRSRFRRRRRA
jgi:hypothetical protein